MRRTFVIAGIAILVAIVAAVLSIDGTDDDGLRAAIRATARTSALCAGLAFARVRVREFSALLPVSHALHYALIVIAGLANPLLAVAAGAALYAVMLWNAVRPNAIAIWIVWLAFLIAIGVNGGRSPLYIAMTVVMLAAGIARYVRRSAKGAFTPV